MSDPLTLRPKDSTESIYISESSTDDEGFDFKGEPEKTDGAFLTGVRRGLRKLGSVSGSRGRPFNIQTSKSSTPDLHPRSGSTDHFLLSQNEKNLSGADLEKPLPTLPSTPTSPIVEDTSGDPPDTPKALEGMPQRAATGNRTSIVDSTSASQHQSSGYKSISGTYKVDMNSSQTSLATSSRQDGSEGGEENRENVVTPKSNGAPSAAPSPAQQPRSLAASGAGTSGATPSTHLSGLMCNVHRTTGKEPHPLVGATTTILGDKLYVFGGRILSRTRPSLTADLYELDLIQRHWTKVETSGDVPPPRYFHSLCALGDTKLVCYGGMSPAPPQSQAQMAASAQSGQESQPEVVVMSDIYIYDAPSRTWTFIPTNDTPQGRYAHCATILPSSAAFASANAPSSALHHNPQGPNPNQGVIGVNIDGTGGAEMVVVGGQDSGNHYIEQISVFNLRSLKWTSTQALELQVRASDGTLAEKPMHGSFSPPGLRFPNGGVIDTNFVVSGTYLTSSKQEYALWALDLRTLTWSRIDAGGSVFSQGSWNRGVLWNRRNTFVILGNRKRSLVEDYNHRRINFANVCMVELEAFGLYDNPRKAAPLSGFVSASSPFTTPSLNIGSKAGWNAGGRTLSKAAEELGQSALALRELADMDILCVGGERIPVNSRIIARRWGPYFVQLLREGTATQDGNDAATLRQESVFRHNQSRNSSITITPSLGAQSSSLSSSSTLNSSSTSDPASLALPPDSGALSPNSRPRTLYLPHTQLTLQALLHFLYTSSLPPNNSTLCTPQILCSLLQLARPYKIDGLLEAVVERLHGVLDSRNAAAVFNASAMAAGGGRSTSTPSDIADPWSLNRLSNGAETLMQLGLDNEIGSHGQQSLRINTSVGDLGTGQGGRRQDDEESMSATSSAASDVSGSDLDGSVSASESGKVNSVGEIWRGDISAVIGLQKRGLRGLMEGRRLRERGTSASVSAASSQKVGLGIANG
ncbi:hypothetical protein SS1G_04703 [Sclerotinia sclerotiorum 1980 UF-70]|uniref:BTB domain-containing protein n=1 Tax=Sclerotinia sclerotiorum (strain ATCC 18683 / 1980 / Ss-1) TaxID=665079 RepID=A7EHB1_SCLS1|nr:hypothetical protein SS1G_04703 [Sclerotinia sclerotiorum 1980 UF-70]EDO02227.1 hypothetical protein SS1G_04703 [Sclerotinia sclerotiorum 1980 UF-70]